MISDFLEAGELIKARLASQLPDVNIATVKDLVGVTENQQISPSVSVVYQSLRINDRARAASILYQRWLTVISARNAQSQSSSSAAQTDVGKIAWKVIQALQGYQLSTDYRIGLELAEGPRAGWSGTWFYLPIGWDVQISITSSN